MAQGKEFHTVHLKFSPSELAEIDAWQERQNMRTRSEAIRQMIRATLSQPHDRQEEDYGMAERGKSSFRARQLTPADPSAVPAELREEIRRIIQQELAAALRHDA